MTDHVEEQPLERPKVEERAEAAELEQATRERDEYLDALQRLKAEFENYKKRISRDQAEFVTRASERLRASAL